jgi:hypothetical protein
MENDAFAMGRGTDTDTENSRTESTAREEALTRRRIRAGHAGNATGKIDGTPAPSSLLNEKEQRWLQRIRTDRANRFMVAVTDVDFLLEVIERLEQC